MIAFELVFIDSKSGYSAVSGAARVQGHCLLGSAGPTKLSACMFLPLQGAV